MTLRPEDAPRLYAVPPPDDDGPVDGRPVELLKNSPLPADPDDEEVLEGEVLDEDETRLPVVRAVIDVATHHRTLAVVRQVVYVAEGASIVARRLWDTRTVARYQRAMRTAEANGDHQAMLEWEVREAIFRKERHQRRVDLLTLPLKLLAVLPKLAIGAVSLLLGVGVLLAIADRDAHRVGDPIKAVAAVVAVVAFVVSVAWGPLVVAAPWVAVLWLWSVGRRGSMDPAWLGTSADADIDVVIDETTIARALEALRIPQITAYFKEGLPLQFIVTARRDGRGTHAVMRLPAGVPAERIARRRADFATGLYRRAQEVWLTTGSEAGVLDMWAADKGALAEGAGPYPLLHEGVTDVFKGVPFGRTLRGDPLMAPIVGRNTIIGGMPDQGKSSGARTITLGCALDPTVEIQIFVPDSNFDFEAFRPRCSVYVMGAEDEKIEQICLALEDVVEDIQVRGELLVRHQQEQITRELAHRNIGLHPKLVLLEEAHLAYGHPKFGQRIAAADEMIVRLGRKRGVHKVTSTQATTGKSVPVMVTINSSNGIAYALGRHQENDAILGQGAYSAGHRATDLIPGEDQGNAVVKGFTGERSAVAQAYYVSPSRGRDQVTPIIERALAEIERRGDVVPGSDTARRWAPARDLLDDLDEVLSVERIKLADLPALLRELAPEWAAYRSLTGRELGSRLKDNGVRVTNSGNIPRLDPADLRVVIAQRSTADLDQ